MEPVSSILFKLFRESPQRSDWIVACLQGAWPGLVGDRIAAACRPASFENSRLTIEILDTAWEEPLRRMKTELLMRIRQGTRNEVQDINFQRS